jgi:4-amino-4-deoxy-L-arabinose transferase-like glycosyltransferase
MPDRRRLRLLIALTVLAAAGVYLAGNGSVSLWDRDEPRYAQCSRQMLQSGDWVVPRLYDEVRTAKPVFIYWCQAAAMKVLGDTAFAARLPSALAMPLTLVLFGAFVWRVAGPRRAAWAVLVLATSAMVLIAAKACLTDSVLLLWVTIGQICLYAMWRGRATWGVVVIYAVATALAGLTKGPVVLGVQGMTLLALWALGRSIRRAAPRARDGERLGGPGRWIDRTLKAVVAVMIVCAVVGPWLYLVQRREPDFLRTSLSHDVVNRVRSGLENHTGPPGYYLATIWPFFLPWSLLLPLAAVVAWKNRHLPLVRFAMAAVLGPWLMFEVVRTKLPHYMLPTYPWLALLVADAIVRCLRNQYPDLTSRAFRVAVSGTAVVLVLCGLALPFVSRRFGDPPWPALAVTAAGVASAAVLFATVATPRPAATLVALGAGVALIWIVTWTVFLPRAQFLRLSIQVAEVLKRGGATAPGDAMMMDYKEPTLAFYQGGTIRPNSAMALSNELVDRAPTWIVTTEAVWAAAPPDVRARLVEVARRKGVAYADEGRAVEVVVLRKSPQASP